jgi:hypothetical protein
LRLSDQPGLGTARNPSAKTDSIGKRRQITKPGIDEQNPACGVLRLDLRRPVGFNRSHCLGAIRAENCFAARHQILREYGEFAPGHKHYDHPVVERAGASLHFDLGSSGDAYGAVRFH